MESTENEQSAEMTGLLWIRRSCDLFTLGSRLSGSCVTVDGARWAGRGGPSWWSGGFAEGEVNWFEFTRNRNAKSIITNYLTLLIIVFCFRLDHNSIYFNSSHPQHQLLFAGSKLIWRETARGYYIYPGVLSSSSMHGGSLPERSSTTRNCGTNLQDCFRNLSRNQVFRYRILFPIL